MAVTVSERQSCLESRADLAFGRGNTSLAFARSCTSRSSKAYHEGFLSTPHLRNLEAMGLSRPLKLAAQTIGVVGVLFLRFRGSNGLLWYGIDCYCTQIRLL